MTDHILGGIGYNARNQFTPNSATPTPVGGHTAIHMAVVVDDIDDYALDSTQKNSVGRVWVYIPGVSAENPELSYARYTPTREPRAADGTPGRPIPEKRAGFILAYPMTPHAGSDRLREAPNQPDGRNPRAGQSVSYGDFHQARNGDLVAVCFMGGDPGRPYVLGHIPKTAEHAMVPGLKQAQTNASGAGVASNVGPSYNRGESDKETKPATVIFNNITDAGLVADALRGCGTSASDRETPSRVRGWKTPGDPDTGMIGHQMVMDDHPNSQLIRLRTSKGAQLLLSDTGDFMFMCTATGKTWIEIDDSGQVHIYAHSSVSIHSEQDFNLVCDRDFNLDVGGNVNWSVKGDTRIRMNGGANLTVGEGGGDLDITTMNNFHVKTQGEIRIGAKTGITAKSADFFAMQSAKDMTMKSAKAFNVKSESTSLKMDRAMMVQTGDDISMKAGKSVNMKAAGGDYNMDTSANMNATKASLSVADATDVNDSNDPNQADLPLEHAVVGPPSTSGPPKSPGGMMRSASPVVPHRHPWPGVPHQRFAQSSIVRPDGLKV